ncbi:MAG: B12-binding domain-containing radical SAM protein, partial [Syntrophales bacterium LBB04]|nr:B12-binding domain-containing radical SAM protein [Syntrophales bacterium LBB04]
MKIILIHPPCCDPTSPYLALPLLAGVLRTKGYETELVDANLEGFTALLNEPCLNSLLARVKKRWRALNQAPLLKHLDQLEYLNLSETLERMPRALEISTALDVLKSYSAGFLDPQRYDQALATIDCALTLIALAYHPLTIDFTQYRTPFTLLSLAEIEREAAPERNPFAAYFAELAERKIKPSGTPLVVGISFVFPGQLQGGFALAYQLRQKYPDLFIIAGGPALTQILYRHPHRQQVALLGPFDTAVLGEGEQALLTLLEMQATGKRPPPILVGGHSQELDSLPAPDFDGLPLSSYLAPEIVLPYDPSRGCYWRKCAFCHYGLVEQST